MILDTEISGIPCRVRVTCYRPPVPPIIGARADDSDPGDPGIVEFEVLDTDGRPDAWLELLLDRADVLAIEQQIIAAKAREQQQDAADLAAAEWGAYA